MYKIGWKKIS